MGRTCLLFEQHGLAQQAFALGLTAGFRRMATGTYGGNGAATLGVVVGFRPLALIIFSQVTNRAAACKTNFDSEFTFVFVTGGANLYAADHIISLDAAGFTVGDGTGTANHLNLAENYTYVAFG